MFCQSNLGQVDQPRIWDTAHLRKAHVKCPANIIETYARDVARLDLLLAHSSRKYRTGLWSRRDSYIRNLSLAQSCRERNCLGIRSPIPRLTPDRHIGGASGAKVWVIGLSPVPIWLVNTWRRSCCVGRDPGDHVGPHDASCHDSGENGIGSLNTQDHAAAGTLSIPQSADRVSFMYHM